MQGKKKQGDAKPRMKITDHEKKKLAALSAHKTLILNRRKSEEKFKQA